MRFVQSATAAVLALAFSASMVSASSEHPPEPAAEKIAAISAKPWAVGFAPVVLGLTQARVRVLLGAGLMSVAAWLPFVVAEPRTLDALRPPVACSIANIVISI